MYYRYQPYPYYRRYHNINPYYYRPYNPYYNYQQNIIDSQISDVNQNIINYGDMNDVIQDSDVYQLMTPAPIENVGICTELQDFNGYQLMIPAPKESVGISTDPIPTPFS